MSYRPPDEGGGPGGPTPTFGSTTVDFGLSSPTPSAVTAEVAESGVEVGSEIVLTVQLGPGRDTDELELAAVQADVGTITPGVGFSVVVTSLDDTAHGQYIVNYSFL